MHVFLLYYIIIYAGVVCAYVCAYVYVRTSMPTYMRMCVRRVRVCECEGAHVLVCVRVSVFMCMRVCARLRVSAHGAVHMHACVCACGRA